MSQSTSPEEYYVPHGTKWPILGSIGLFMLTSGFAITLNGTSAGESLMILGACVLIYMMFGWWGTTIGENLGGLYNKQVDDSFRQGMLWFILSEVFFFSAFFGALYYIRIFSVPWLGGEGISGMETHAQLWTTFEGIWPTNGPDQLGGPFSPMGAWGIPALNTALLLSSGVTCTIAHHAILHNQIGKFNLWTAITVVLGVVFLGFQAYEYSHAYGELNLTLESGVYGSTFFMLTGFHGLHVTMGVIMLTVALVRGLKGHFSAEEHFGFEAAAWYWHFVDVVWLGLFIFVYWF